MGKFFNIHYFDWAIFHSYVNVYQRVFHGEFQSEMDGLKDYLDDLDDLMLKNKYL